MKKFIKFSLFVTLLIASHIRLSAQDIITLNDGTRVKATIIELGETEVKYKIFGSKIDRVITLERTVIKDIKLFDGSPDPLSGESIQKNYYFNDKTSNLKIGFTSIFNDAFTLAYEHALSPQYSVEGILRFQGIGFDDTRTSNSGFGIGVAGKVNLSSNGKKAARNAHILADYFIKPEFYINYTKFNFNNSNSIFSSPNLSTTKGGLILNFGRQWVLAERLSLEVFFGVGYAITLNNVKNPNNNCIECSDFDFTGGGEIRTFNKVGISSGLRVGYVFGNSYGSQAPKK